MRKHPFTLAALVTFVLAGWSLAADAPAPAEAKPVKMDAYGDPLPADALVRLGSMRWRHSGQIMYVAYSADGKQLITGCQDGSLRVWEADSGKEIRRFGKVVPGQPGFDAQERLRRVAVYNMMSAMSLSPDGQVLAAGGQDGSVTLWDVANGKEIRSWKTNPPQGIHATLFAPDGKSLIVKAYNQVIYQYAVEDGKELRKITNVFNPQAGQKEQLFYGGNPSTSIALADQGKVLVAAAMLYENNQVTAVLKRWELETGKELPALKGPQMVGFQSVAMTPDQKVAAFAVNDGSIRLWDMAAGKELRQFGNPQQGGYPQAMNFAPDGKRLATRGSDQYLRIWDVESGKELHVLGGIAGQNQPGFSTIGYSPSNLAFTADGKTLAGGTGGNTIRQWDVTTGKDVALPPGHSGGVATLAAAPEGKTVVTRGWDNTVRIWDSATGKELRSFETPGMNGHAAFSPDGRVLVLLGYDSLLRVWDVAAGKEVSQTKVPVNNFMTLAVSPDGKTAAARSYDMVIRLWDIGTGKELRQIAFVPDNGAGAGAAKELARAAYYNPGVPLLVFSPDGTMIAGSGGGNNRMVLQDAKGDRIAPMRNNTALTIWDATTGKILRRFEPSSVGIGTFAFAPDGRTIASGNLDGTISLWELASGKERCQFKPTEKEKKEGEPGAGPGRPGNFAMPQNVRSITFLRYSPDGKLLVGGGADRVVRFWDALSGKELKSLTGHQNTINCLAFAANGKTVITGSMDTTALVWPADDLKLEVPQPVDVDAAQVDALWKDLASEDARKAYEAVRTLGIGRGPVLAALKERVRAVPAPDARKIAQLIADLDSNMFAVRQKATDELEKLGELVEPDLKRVLEGQPPLEMRMRVDKLLERLVNAAPPTPEELRSLRALEVLEMQGSTEARETLEAIAKGAAGARLTRFAQSALNNFARRS